MPVSSKIGFSPGSCFLYGSGPGDVFGVFQYDLRRGPDSSFISRSAVLINTPDGIAIRNDRSDDYQIGPDGRLYTARYSGLGIIRYPDVKGLACGYDPGYLRIDTTASVVNFPNFVDSWFADPTGCSIHPLRPFTTDTLLCQYDIADFSAPWVGRPDISVEWRIPGSEVLERTDTTISVRFVEPGEHLVKVLWSDTVNGADSAVGVVRVHPAQVVSAGPDTTLCRGESFLLGAPENLEAGGSVLFAWSPSFGLDDSTLARPTASFATRGRYILHAVDTVTGCETIDTISVEVNPLPFVDAGPDTALCAEGEVRLQANDFALDPGHTFRWEPSEGLDCDTCFAVTAQVRRTTTWRVTVTNRFGCSLSDSVRVSVLDASFAGAIADTLICAGESLRLGYDPAAGLLYDWQPRSYLDRGDVSSPLATPEETMTWRVTVTDTASGCVARDSITVRVAEPPVADAGADVESCPYGEVVLGLHIDDLSPQYFWRRVGSDSVLASSALFPLGRMEGDYELEAVDRTTGCRARDTVRVVFHESPAVSAGEDIRFCVSDPGVLLGPAEFDSELQYRWEPTTGLLDPFSPRTGVGPDAGGTYVLHAIDPTTGCKGTDTVEVTQREGAALRFSIGREYRGASGEPIVVTVLGDDVATAAGVTRLKIEIGYDPRVVVPEPSSVEELLGGTMLDGWQVEESAVVSAGLLQVTLRAPSGASLQSAGELLRLRLNLYLSGAFGSELSLRVETDATCVEVDTEPGYVRLVSMC